MLLLLLALIKPIVANASGAETSTERMKACVASEKQEKEHASASDLIRLCNREFKALLNEHPPAVRQRIADFVAKEIEDMLRKSD